MCCPELMINMWKISLKLILFVSAFQYLIRSWARAYEKQLRLYFKEFVLTAFQYSIKSLNIPVVSPTCLKFDFPNFKLNS